MCLTKGKPLDVNLKRPSTCDTTQWSNIKQLRMLCRPQYTHHGTWYTAHQLTFYRANEQEERSQCKGPHGSRVRRRLNACKATFNQAIRQEYSRELLLRSMLLSTGQSAVLPSCEMWLAVETFNVARTFSGPCLTFLPSHFSTEHVKHNFTETF
jgi:hypothetical protein